MDLQIKQTESDKEIQDCFAVMSQLRPHLKMGEFLSLVRRQMQDGYRLAYVKDKDDITTVAGYRISHSLSWGRYLYVDDLVTDAARRSSGFGKAMLQWLFEEARREQCNQFHLDSGTQRKDAHRFYAREGMDMVAYHFVLSL